MSVDRLANPPRIPPRPMARNEHEFKNLSPEAQAQAIFEFQNFWQDCAPVATGVSGVSFAPLAVQAPPVPFDNREGSGVNRQQMQEAADSELREAIRIRNQGL